MVKYYGCGEALVFGLLLGIRVSKMLVSLRIGCFFYSFLGWSGPLGLPPGSAHESTLEMCNLSWPPSNPLNHSCVSPKMGCLEYTRVGKKRSYSRLAIRVIAHVTCLPTEILGESAQQITFDWPFYPRAGYLSY